MSRKQNKPIRNKEDIARNPDPKIKEDYNGYLSEEQQKATTNEKDGEKHIIHPDKRKGLDEQDSDGSANAFEDK